jgi:4-hydroxy-3-methylbut-2-en-1-yl diphosphate synthase IspG/GcpE
MLAEHEHACPLCGRVLTTWHEFHQHVAREHESAKTPAARRMSVHPDDAALTRQVLSGTWNGEQG